MGSVYNTEMGWMGRGMELIGKGKRKETELENTATRHLDFCLLLAVWVTKEFPLIFFLV